VTALPQSATWRWSFSSRLYGHLTALSMAFSRGSGGWEMVCGWFGERLGAAEITNGSAAALLGIEDLLGHKPASFPADNARWPWASDRPAAGCARQPLASLDVPRLSLRRELSGCTINLQRSRHPRPGGGNGLGGPDRGHE
jgi:hypothetical protein